MTRFVERPRRLHALLDEPFALLRAHWKLALMIIVPGRLVMALPGAINQLLWNQVGDNPTLALGMLSGTMVVVALTYALAGWLVLVEYRLVRGLLDGETPSPWTCYRAGLDPGAFCIVALMAMCMGVGMACFVLPGVAIAAMLGLVVAAVMASRNGVVAGVKSALELALPLQGRWGVLGLGLTVAFGEWLLLASMSGMTGIPGMIYGGYASWESAASGSSPDAWGAMMPTWVVLVQNFGGAVLSAPVDFVSATSFTLLYHHARASRQGTDLALQVQARLTPKDA